MTNDESDSLQLSEKTIASDEMFTVRRIEQADLPSEIEGGLNFREILAERLLFLEQIFVDGGWPYFFRRVVVTGEGKKDWDEIPDGSEDLWGAEGIPPNSELLDPNGRHRVELGINFIHRRVADLTDDHWMILEAVAIKRALDAASIDQALEAGHALGELHEQAHLHGLHLPAVRRRRKQLDSLKSDVDGARKEHNRKRATNVEEWSSIARETAAKFPALRGEALARRINRELERQGLPTMSGRSIRRALSKS